MQDVSSRPECSPRQTRPPKVRKILHLRTKRGWGLARTAHKLGMHPSTVNRVLRREGAALLSEVDLATRKAHPRLVAGDVRVRLAVGGGRLQGRPRDGPGGPSAAHLDVGRVVGTVVIPLSILVRARR